MGKEIDQAPPLETASELAASDVLTVEALAMRTGITGDQAQELLDRLGNDRAAIEDAARSLKAAEGRLGK